jgi:hypothetical protein
MKNQKIDITGSPFEGMGDFAIDFTTLKKRFGTTVQEVPVEDTVEASKTISGEAVKQQIAKGNILDGLSIFCKQLGFDFRIIEGE